MYTLKVEGAFEAAHRVVNYPGKCDRLHGHNWKVEAVVRGTELDELGMLVDFKAIKNALRPPLPQRARAVLCGHQPDGREPRAHHLRGACRK